MHIMEEEHQAVQNRDADLCKFLAKVDEVGLLVSDLTTSDSGPGDVAAIKRADDYLDRQARDRVVQDRTVINNIREPESDVEKGIFMKTLEGDAKEREERRKEREAEGQKHKKRGNVAFRAGDYSTAVKEFSVALKHTPWDVSLYTNRALAYNQLGQHDEAVVDCDDAIRLEPSTLKAYVQKAKALTSLNRETDAIASYVAAEKQFSNKAEFIAGLRKKTFLKRVKSELHISNKS